MTIKSMLTMAVLLLSGSHEGSAASNTSGCVGDGGNLACAAVCSTPCPAGSMCPAVMSYCQADGTCGMNSQPACAISILCRGNSTGARTGYAPDATDTYVSKTHGWQESRSCVRHPSGSTNTVMHPCTPCTHATICEGTCRTAAMCWHTNTTACSRRKTALRTWCRGLMVSSAVLCCAVLCCVLCCVVCCALCSVRTIGGQAVLICR